MAEHNLSGIDDFAQWTIKIQNLEVMLKFKMALNIALCTSVAVSSSALAASAAGKVKTINVPTNADVNTVYFKLDPMPQDVSKWFYIRHGSGTSAGCTLGGSEKTTDRTYSMLLTAKASSTNVTAYYCVDSNGYGLVNSSLIIE